MAQKLSGASAQGLLTDEKADRFVLLPSAAAGNIVVDIAESFSTIFWLNVNMCL